MFEFDRKKFGDRVSEMRKAQGYSRRALAKVISVSDAAIQKYEEGKSVPAFDVAAKLSEFGGKPLHWLLTGIENNNQDASLNNKPSIPHYEIQPSAGNGLSEFIPSEGRYVSFDESWFKQFVPIGAVLGMLDVNGDSMMPTLRSGDSIIVNMNQDHITAALAEGGIFVFSIRGDFKVKRLQPMANGDLRIISDNEKYQNETITAEMVADDIHIQAVVIKRIGDP